VAHTGSGLTGRDDREARPVLVVGPSWVGDMVMAQSLFMTLALREPRPPVDVLAPAWSHGLLARMPEVRHAIELPLGHGDIGWRTRRRVAEKLRVGNYAQAIVLPNSLKSALIPFFARIPLRTGWRGEMRYGLLNDLRRLDQRKYPLMVQRFAALALAPGAVPAKVPWPRLRAQPSGASDGDPRDAPLLALCPGAEFGESKRWPGEYFGTLAAAMIARGWQVRIFGSQREAVLGNAIRAAIAHPARERCVNLAGKTSLGEAVDLLAGVTAVVSNDSGLMHVAAALGKPLVAIYGGSSPRFTPPLGEAVSVLRTSLACSPCYQRSCRFGHYRCLREQQPDAVLGALQGLLDAALGVNGARRG